MAPGSVELASYDVGDTQGMALVRQPWVHKVQ